MRLPKLRLGDSLYATRQGSISQVVTITDVDRDTFYVVWADGRPEGVSRRQLRQYGRAYGCNLVEFTVAPQGAVRTQASPELVHVAEGNH